MFCFPFFREDRNVLWFPGSPLILKLLLRLRKFTQGQSEHSYNRSLDRRIMYTLIITNIMFSSARLCKRIVGLSRHRTIATVSYFYELVLWFWIRNGYPWSNKFALFVRKNNNFNIKGLPGNHKTFTGKRTYEGAADPECLNRPGFKGILYTHVVIYRTIF
jgi:hypothetical protein